MGCGQEERQLKGTLRVLMRHLSRIYKEDVSGGTHKAWLDLESSRPENPVVSAKGDSRWLGCRTSTAGRDGGEQRGTKDRASDLTKGQHTRRQRGRLIFLLRLRRIRKVEGKTADRNITKTKRGGLRRW